VIRAGYEDPETGKNLFDEESDWMLERNIKLGIPGTDLQAKIAVPFGTAQLAWGTAIHLTKFLFGDRTAGETLANISKVWVKSMAPIAPSEASITKDFLTWLGQTATPTIAKPAMNVVFNRNSFGSPLNPKSMREDKAEALQGKRNTEQFYKDIALWAARMGADMTPEAWKEMIEGYLAGPIKEFILKPLVKGPAREEANKVLAAAGKQTSAQVSTLFDRFITSSNDDALKQKLFYRYTEEMQDIAVKESLGKELSQKEKRMLDLYKETKKDQARANAIMARATKSKNEREIERARIESAKEKVLIERKVLKRMSSMGGLE
jgi:hypothetical protein